MKYKSQGKQLTIEDFRSSLCQLPKSNRWVMLGDNLPWEAIEKLYNSKLNNLYIIIEKGANFYLKSIPLRKDFKVTKNA